MFYFYYSEEMHFHLLTYLLTGKVACLLPCVFTHLFSHYQLPIQGDIVKRWLKVSPKSCLENCLNFAKGYSLWWYSLTSGREG